MFLTVLFLSTLAPGILWQSHIPPAGTEKPVLILYTSQTCDACKDLAKDTLTDPRVIERINDFVPVHLTATNRSPVRWVPTILVLNREGGFVKRIEGLVSATELLAELKGIR